MLFMKYNRILFFLKKKKNFPQHIMMKNPKPEEENIIKDVRNLFIQKKKLKQLKLEYLEILRIF